MAENLKHQTYEKSYIEDRNIVFGLLLPLLKIFNRKNNSIIKIFSTNIVNFGEKKL